ncbi:olfactory receptor 5J3-like [Leptodactylus fuscus]|uniref:olfactory receptor 5J3-like n=1 Tax=Leptodactylus fuscus TaxID=238119 RepID=UPI003F4E8262
MADGSEENFSRRPKLSFYKRTPEPMGYFQRQINTTRVNEFFLLGVWEQSDLHLLFFVVFTIIYVVTVGGNVVFISIIRSQHRLRTPMYFFLENLSFLDVSLSTVIVPHLLNILLVDHKVISFVGCVTQTLFYQLIIVAECFLLATMAYDRYLAICQPLQYSLVMVKPFLVAMILLCWFLGVAYSLTNTIFIFQLVFCGPNIIPGFFCDAPLLFQLSCSDSSGLQMFQFIAGIFVGPIPALIVVSSYIAIITTIVRINSAKGKWKTFSTCASHLTVVTLFYGTGIFTYVIQPGVSKQTEMKDAITVVYTIIAPMLNPFIYSFRNQEVHNGWKRLWREIAHFMCNV